MLEYLTNCCPIVLEEIGKALQKIGERKAKTGQIGGTIRSEDLTGVVFKDESDKIGAPEAANTPVDLPAPEEAFAGATPGVEIIPGNSINSGIKFVAEGAEQPAPGAQGATVQPGAPAVELDTTGLPWDERIHASTKTKIKKSTIWKFKPGVDATVKASVLAELRVQYPEQVNTPNLAPGGKPLPHPDEVFGGAPTEAAAYTWVSLLMEVNTVVQSGQKTQEEANVSVNAVLQQLGIASITQLQEHPDKIDQVRESLSLLLGPRT